MNLILIICLITLGSSHIAHDKKRVKITQKSLIGDWYTGPGIKYHVDQNGNVINEQPLPSMHYLMKYRKDSTMWHEGHGSTLTWEVIEGDKIIYDKGTTQERIYKVEIFTQDSMQVYGPFTKDRKRYDPNALFRLTQYR